MPRFWKKLLSSDSLLVTLTKDSENFVNIMDPERVLIQVIDDGEAKQNTRLGFLKKARIPVNRQGVMVRQ